MKLIRNAKIITCAGEAYENGYIIIEETKIKEAGPMEQLNGSYTFEEEIDASGKTVTPGLVDGHCHAGLWQDSTSDDENDGNEITDSVTPDLRAFDAVNPCDRAFSDAVAAGITSVVTGPGSANLIGGAFCALKTHGVCVDDMVIKQTAAMKFAFGENPKLTHSEKDVATRMAAAAAIRENLEKTKIYAEKKRRALEECGDEPEFDAKLEALIPVIEGRVIVKAHAHRANDIFTALRIGRDFGLKMTVEHCSDGVLIKERLAKENFGGVLAGPVSTTRSKPELSGFDMSLAAQLLKSGIKTAIITDYPEEPFAYLAVNAALMQKYGVDRDEALRMITLYPAELCGIADRVGSIEPGKDADIVIWNAHPLDVTSETECVFIEGNSVYKGKR